MNEKKPSAMTGPGPTLTFTSGVKAEPAVFVSSGPARVVTVAPPLSAVKHLLTGKPLRGVRKPSR